MTDTRRHAIVTGAASGLGRALAVRLARDGWHIALADIDAHGSEATLRVMEAAGGTGEAVRLDVSCQQDWIALHDRLRATWPRIDLLVNNAGMGCTGDVGVFPLEEWNLLLNVNLRGAIYGCHMFVDWLKENPDGAHIINVASFAAIAPMPSMSAYNVSKAGIVALSEALYCELQPHGVGVTVVCPMHFKTNINSAMRVYHRDRAEALRDAVQQSTTSAADVADIAVRSMERKKLYAIPGWRARWYWWLRRLAPAGFQDGIARDAQRLEATARDADRAAE